MSLAAESPSPRAEEARTTRRRWPLGLMGMLAFVALAERYIDSRREDFGSIFTIEWRRAGDSIPRHASEAKVLCFGSSLTKMGVATKVLEEKLGVPAYNFAASGSQPYADYTALRHALAAGAKPSAIVVEFTWSILETPYDWNCRVLTEFASPAECAELAIATRDTDFLARIMLDRLLPSYRNRVEARANIQAALSATNPTSNRPVQIAMARNSNVNHGASHASPTGVAPAMNFNDPVTFPTDWKCTPVSETYLHKFLELAESRGIPVFWIIPPITSEAQRHRDATGAEARYTQFVRQVIARHIGVTVVDGRTSGYADLAFVDMVHLNRDGAVAFTDDLAELIRDRLGRRGGEGTRWVAMPPYRPDPLASRVEDLGRSAALVQDAMARGLLR